MDELKRHDVVALTKPIPEHNIRRGDIGVVIDMGPHGQCLLEFADRNGIPLCYAHRQPWGVYESVFTCGCGRVNKQPLVTAQSSLWVEMDH